MHYRPSYRLDRLAARTLAVTRPGPHSGRRAPLTSPPTAPLILIYIESSCPRQARDEGRLELEGDRRQRRIRSVTERQLVGRIVPNRCHRVSRRHQCTWSRRLVRNPTTTSRSHGSTSKFLSQTTNSEAVVSAAVRREQAPCVMNTSRIASSVIAA